MKKKIVTFAMVFALAAVAVVGGSLAYFTDKDDADNVFAVGSVNITLVEEQRGTGNVLENFTNNSTLIPVVEKNPGEYPTAIDGENEITLPVEAGYENYKDKIIRVTNSGVSEAYVRLFIAVPAALDSKNGLILVEGKSENWTEKDKLEGSTFINGIEYNVYSKICKLAAGETSDVAYYGVYLHSSVDCDDNGSLVITTVSNTGESELKTVESAEYLNEDSQLVIPVFAQAIQVAGFDTAAEAFAASGLTSNPWAE